MSAESHRQLTDPANRALFELLISFFVIVSISNAANTIARAIKNAAAERVKETERMNDKLELIIRKLLP